MLVLFFVLDKKLSPKNDLATIEDLLKGLANEWQSLGTQLGVSKKALSKIASAPADNPMYMNNLLLKWLNGNFGSPTVSKLVGALTEMKGTKKYVENVFAGKYIYFIKRLYLCIYVLFTAFDEPPVDTSSTTSTDSFASANDGTGPPDGGTPATNYPSLDSASKSSWTSNDLTVRDDPHPGESSVDKKISADEGKPQTLSTETSQDEHEQLMSHQSPALVPTLRYHAYIYIYVYYI